MRPISGFDRPFIQWLLVALSLILIATAGGAAWIARRANAAVEATRLAEEGGRQERHRLDAQLARERSSREALALELARQREGGVEPARVMPTLTLTPLAQRGATPPAATATAQHATQLIELRLVLPAAGAPNQRFDIVLRDWSRGDTVWSRGGLAPSRIDGQPMVTAFVTGDVFRPGAYELLVTAANAAGQKEEVAAYEIAFK